MASWGVSPTPGTRTVTQGQSASYAVSVVAQGGSFDETVALSCSGAPSQATCTFDQDQITLVGGQAAATMTVTTAAPAGFGPVSPGTPALPPWGWLGVGLALLAGLGLWRRAHTAVLKPAGGSWDRSRRIRVPRIRQWALMAAAGGVLVLLQASCGSDKTSPPTGGTPTGTYELTITATWETAQTSSSATLVVQ
jgi:hypothetical protein